MLEISEAEKKLQAKYASLLSEYYYDPITGYIYKKDNNRRMMPDDDNSLVIYSPSTKKKFTVKLDRLSHFFAFGVYPDSKSKVLHKNLDQKDNSIKNIKAVPSAVYNKIIEAKLNLEYDLRIIPHPVYKLNTGVRYRKDSQVRTRWFDDFGAAQLFLKDKQLEAAKILAKYVVVD